jgi:hypothetical protein
MVSLNDLCDRPPQALAVVRCSSWARIGSATSTRLMSPRLGDACLRRDDEHAFAGDLLSGRDPAARPTTSWVPRQGKTCSTPLPDAEHRAHDPAAGRFAHHDRGDARLVVQRDGAAALTAGRRLRARLTASLAI